MRLFSIKPGITIRGRAFRGLRGWAGKPWHPPLTDFPIVCVSLGALFDLISRFSQDGTERAQDFYVAASFVLIAGQVVALGATLTGFWDWWKGLDRERSNGALGRATHTQVWRTANWHAILMISGALLTAVNIATRLGNFDLGRSPSLNVVLSILAAIAMLLGATYGGALVFDHQFNVESLKGSTAWDETEHDQLPGDRSKG